MESNQIQQAKAETEEQDRKVLKNIENSMLCSPNTTPVDSVTASFAAADKENSTKVEQPKAKRRSSKRKTLPRDIKVGKNGEIIMNPGTEKNNVSF